MLENCLASSSSEIKDIYFYPIFVALDLKKHIPNLLTLANLASGMLIIISAFMLQFKLVAVFAAFCLLFDFLDGFVARLLHVKSKLGAELDSLADGISFGAAPALVLFNYYQNEGVANPLFFGCLLIALFAAYRLAIFNITEQSGNYFQGMPTPIYALGSFAIPLASEQLEWTNIALTSPVFIICYVLIGGGFMLSSFKLMNMKFNKTEKILNRIRISFLFLCVVLILWLNFFGLFLCLPAYLLVSLATQKQMS